MNNNSELNSLPTEATPKNTELDIFVNLLRQADISNTKNEKEDYLKTISCYEKALFGDEKGFKGYFVESIFVTLGKKVISYTKRFFDFTIIENYLRKINNAVKTREIVKEDHIHIFQLTKVIEQAINNQLTYLINDLVEKAKDKYPLDHNWDLKADSYYKSSINRKESIYADNEVESDEVSEVERYNLWMRITSYEYIQLVYRQMYDTSEGVDYESQKKVLQDKHDRLVEKVVPENKIIIKEKERLKDTEKGLGQKALPFCNLINECIDESEKNKNDYNYRKIMPRLYYAIDYVFGSKYDRKDAEKYDVKSFLLKTILNIQLRRIAVKVKEEDIDKTKEYFFILLENLIGVVPSEKAKQSNSVISKYKDSISFKNIESRLKNSFVEVFLVDLDKPLINEHRSYFLKGIVEFCYDTLDLIKEKDDSLYNCVKRVFNLFAESTYDKLFPNGEIKYAATGLNNNYQAYYCAVIFYATGGNQEKLNAAIKIARRIEDTSAKEDEKNQLNKDRTLLEIRLAAHEKSNLEDVIKSNEPSIVYGIIQSGDDQIKNQLNRQAFYDILYKLYSNKKIDDQSEKFIKDGLSNSVFIKFLMAWLLQKRKYNYDGYANDIAPLILNNAVLLESAIGVKDDDGISDKKIVSDDELTIFVLNLILKSTKDISDDDLKKIVKIICNKYGNEFGRNTDNFAILKSLTKIVIAKNSKEIMLFLMDNMISWRRNYYVDNEFLKIFINYQYFHNQNTEDDNEAISKLKGKLADRVNPFLSKNFYNWIKGDSTLKAKITDSIYTDLMDIFKKNSQVFSENLKNYVDKNLYFLNLLNITNFNVEIGKIEEAEIEFNEALKDGYYLRYKNEFTIHVDAIKKLINAAKARTNKGLSRFSGAKTLVDDWRRHYSSKGIDERRRIIKEKIEAHDTKPMRDIIYLLRDHPYVKRFIHDLGSDEKAKTPGDLIRICKPILETDHLMLNESLPFDFGKTLYDYYSTEKWNCWNGKDNTTALLPSLKECKSFDDEKYEDCYSGFNNMLRIERLSLLFKVMSDTSSSSTSVSEVTPLLTLKLMPKDMTSIKRKGKGLDGGYRIYLPSVQNAIRGMESETRVSTKEGKEPTLIPRITTAKYFNSNCVENDNHLFIELINPYPKNANNLNGLVDNMTKGTGGTFSIVQNLWGVCDLAIQCRYKGDDGFYKLAHKNILGKISEFEDEEKNNVEIENSDEWFKYIIKIYAK